MWSMGNSEMQLAIRMQVSIIAIGTPWVNTIALIKQQKQYWYRKWCDFFMG